MNKNLDILNMSDEEFLKNFDEPVVEDPPTEPSQEEAPVEDPVEEPEGQEENAESEESQENIQETPAEEDPEDAPGSTNEPEEDPKVPSEGEIDPAPAGEAPAPSGDGEASGKAEEEVVEGSEVDYEAFFKRVMAPFKANGKMIKLNTPDEVIALMQMGANYTKKMQAIQPYRKYLMMLENNELLNEEKLSFLIDLDKKNPEAIKKLLKDSNIDPIDIDTSAEIEYKGGTHRVTDQAVMLQEIIDDIHSLDGGMETTRLARTWDNVSKDLLWKDPQILRDIHNHRTNGIYDVITTEIERRRALQQIPLSTPFLHAYKAVGDELAAQGAFQNLLPGSQTPAPRAAPVAVRTQKRNPKVVDNQKARAAAPPRSTPRKTAKEVINPLAMDDEEFLAQFKGKV